MKYQPGEDGYDPTNPDKEKPPTAAEKNVARSKPVESIVNNGLDLSYDAKQNRQSIADFIKQRDLVKASIPVRSADTNVRDHTDALLAYSTQALREIAGGEETKPKPAIYAADVAAAAQLAQGNPSAQERLYDIRAQYGSAENREAIRRETQQAIDDTITGKRPVGPPSVEGAPTYNAALYNAGYRDVAPGGDPSVGALDNAKTTVSPGQAAVTTRDDKGRVTGYTPGIAAGASVTTTESGGTIVGATPQQTEAALEESKQRAALLQNIQRYKPADLSALTKSPYAPTTAQLKAAQTVAAQPGPNSPIAKAVPLSEEDKELEARRNAGVYY